MFLEVIIRRLYTLVLIELYLWNIVWLGNLYSVGDLLPQGHEMAVPTGFEPTMLEKRSLS
jgi:hypothetical protein